MAMIPCVLIVGFGNSDKLGIDSTETENTLHEIGIIVWMILLLLVNSLLLCFYVKGLHNLTKIYPNAKDGELLNTRVHELIIEESRYVVLFSILMCFDLIFGIIYVIMGAGTGLNNSKITTILFIIGLMQLIVLIQSVFLSFKFHHDKYEKICCFCDKFVRKQCEKIVRRPIQNKSNELRSSLLDDPHL